MQRRPNGANEYVSAGMGNLWGRSGSKESNGLAAQEHRLGYIVGGGRAAATPGRGRSGSGEWLPVHAFVCISHTRGTSNISLSMIPSTERSSAWAHRQTLVAHASHRRAVPSPSAA